MKLCQFFLPGKGKRVGVVTATPCSTSPRRARA